VQSLLSKFNIQSLSCPKKTSQNFTSGTLLSQKQCVVVINVLLLRMHGFKLGYSRLCSCLETYVRFFFLRGYEDDSFLFYCLLFLLSTVYDSMLPQWRNKG